MSTVNDEERFDAICLLDDDIERDANLLMRQIQQSVSKKRKWGSLRGTPKAERQMKCRYGLTVEEFLHLKEKQQDKCLLCGETPKRLVVDHCHTTGQVRGLLCNSCNVSLGGYERMKKLGMDKIEEYLEGSN